MHFYISVEEISVYYFSSFYFYDLNFYFYVYSSSSVLYFFLNIFKKLEPTQEQQVKAEAQRIYESVEAKGSILEGVKGIEQKLRERYESMAEERETLKTKTGTIYKGGTYGTEYDPSDEEKKKKPKHVPKTGQKGRPKKDKPAEYSKSNENNDHGNNIGTRIGPV